jgi:hypothetical protein
VSTQKSPEKGTSNTNVQAPGTSVNVNKSPETGVNTVVTAPGTKAVSTPTATAVRAPGTQVYTDNRSGATAVNYPGGTVRVAPNGATQVTAPFVGLISVGGRRMLRA